MDSFSIFAMFAEKGANHKNMKDHIEANHLEGISVPCNLCEEVFRSRHSKANHVSLFHRDKPGVA